MNIDEMIQKIDDVVYPLIEKHKDDKPVARLRARDMAIIIIETFDLKIKPKESRGLRNSPATAYIRDENYPLMYHEIDLTPLIKHFKTYKDIRKETDFETVIEFYLYSEFRNTVEGSLIPKTIKSLEVINIAPDHLCLFNNAVYDVKTGKFDYKLDNYKEYQFVSMINATIPKPKQIKAKVMDKVDKLFDYWAGNKKEQRDYFYRLFYSICQGHGHRMTFFLNNGNEKSKQDFINLLAYMTHGSHTKIGINELDNRRKILAIDGYSKLMYDTEVFTEFKNWDCGSRFRLLTSGEGVSETIPYKTGTKRCLHYGAKVFPSKLTKKYILSLDNLSTTDRMTVVQWPKNICPIDLSENTDELLSHIVYHVLTTIENWHVMWYQSASYTYNIRKK